MADYTKIDFSNYSVKGMAQYFSRVNPIPFDESSVFYSLSAAQEYVDGPTSYAGQIIAVVDIDSKKVTPYVINVDRKLQELGGGKAMSAVTYDDAKILATKENIGQIIYVSENEYKELDPQPSVGDSVEGYYKLIDGEYVKCGEEYAEEGVIYYLQYSSGPYISIGDGEISKLGTTSPSGDVQQELDELKKRVSELENEPYLYWDHTEDDEIGD